MVSLPFIYANGIHTAITVVFACYLFRSVLYYLYQCGLKALGMDNNFISDMTNAFKKSSFASHCFDDDFEDDSDSTCVHYSDPEDINSIESPLYDQTADSPLYDRIVSYDETYV